MADRESTKAALFAAIEAELADVSKLSALGSRVKVVHDLALAYRYAAGGPQPGSGAGE
ncbi:hypothetical protein LJR042_003539 [Microbacterium maritypicum]|uniref:hypothetical protein n=1 Tax=Microbacterium maritypicum TaxID=33918 RepID=UPI00147815F2|nr:hypothetical protein [Microbacterium liquefaciens]